MPHRPFHHAAKRPATRRKYFSLQAALLCLIAIFAALTAARADSAADYPQIRALFPAADHFGASEGAPPAHAVYADDKLLGYAFFTANIAAIPAYSGRPINLLVGIDTGGHITGAHIVQHEEPILAAGISEGQLAKFVVQYRGKPASGRILVGEAREGYAKIDAISGATISIMVINASITRAAKIVAESRGIVVPDVPARAVPQTAREMLRPPSSHDETAVAAQAASPRTRLDQAPIGSSAVAASVPPPGPVHAVEPPAVLPNVAEEDEPMWRALWQQRKVEIALLVPGLILLTCILLFQDFLARRPSLLHRVRTGFLIYTLFFIGWYALGQLSIVNVLTFVQAVTHEFSWDTFLIDPTLFILWSFVAVTLLLWGRGVYCGWLCPFGAFQELIFKLARKLKLPFFEIPHVVHERMLALKFVILLVLFGLSLQSMSTAIRFAEIEPFKTVITLRFQREWGYVAFALGVLVIAAFNRKFYCKYLCPLGAALIIPGRFHSFEWLRRRKECGKPCQACAVECEVQAIRPTGEIVVNECHHCLDCQVAYYNDHKCLPLVEKRTRRERRSRASPRVGEKEEAPLALRLEDIPVAVKSFAAENSRGASASAGQDGTR